MDPRLRALQKRRVVKTETYEYFYAGDVLDEERRTPGTVVDVWLEPISLCFSRQVLISNR